MIIAHTHSRFTYDGNENILYGEMNDTMRNAVQQNIDTIHTNISYAGHVSGKWKTSSLFQVMIFSESHKHKPDQPPSLLFAEKAGAYGKIIKVHTVQMHAYKHSVYTLPKFQVTSFRLRNSPYDFIHFSLLTLAMQNFLYLFRKINYISIRDSFKI